MTARQSADYDAANQCTRCHGDLGWYGHHGAWEPCPDCDPPARVYLHQDWDKRVIPPAVTDAQD